MLKAVVILTWLLELVHTILIWHTIYSLTITFFGQEDQVFTPPRTFYLTLLFSTLVTTTVQIFFAKRIQLFSQEKLVPFITCILAGVVSMGVVAIVALLSAHNTLEILKPYRWLGSIVLALTAFVDVLIATSMCYFLQRARSADFQKTATIIDTLITWSIESTVVKSGASIIQLVLFLTRPNDFLWIIFFVPKASLFSNSMLASLNGRQRLTSVADDSAGGAMFINFNSAAGSGLGSQEAGRNRNMVIQMTRMTETHIDDGNDESVATESKTDVQCN
ncbi:hypothetical protein MVEN_01217600 [Mycena venus]|uniref:DUF6534 domain-containing protein n=1 Tax=Mycena venus TaxID=2733690 RepID=A0A8H7CYF2_9AGAR|nr:hypothetical protein MVEN_01217600 [Mycena venus]